MVDASHYQSMCTRLAELEALNRRLQGVLETRSAETKRIIAGNLLSYLVLLFIPLDFVT